MTDPGRREELALRLAEVRGRIAKACQAAGREVSELTLIAVTKTRPASDVRLLHELGLADVGENRDSEAAPKAAQCADLDLTWHFVGQLQSPLKQSGEMRVERVDIHRVILPTGNKKDLRELPENVRAEMEFICVERIEDVFAAMMPELAERLAVTAAA